MALRTRVVTVLVLSSAMLTGARANQDDSSRRLTPAEIAALVQGGPGAGSSGVAGIRTAILAGDPTKPGLYTIKLSVPAHTRIEAHRHGDDRSATVVSGTWYLGYGQVSTARRSKRFRRAASIPNLPDACTSLRQAPRPWSCTSQATDRLIRRTKPRLLRGSEVAGLIVFATCRLCMNTPAHGACGRTHPRCVGNPWILRTLAGLRS